MNSTVEEVTDEMPEFPCLREDCEGMVILFSGPGRGTVVHKGKGPRVSGYHSINWTPGLFKPTDKVVNLFN